GEVGVDISKSTQEALGVANSHACGAIGLHGESRGSPFDDGGRRAQGGPKELVGVLLLPAQASQFSINLYRQAVSASYGDRTRPKAPDSTLRHPEGEQRVVFELPAPDRGHEIGRNGLHLLASYETRQVQSVNSTVREYRGGAHDRWVIAPAHARIVGFPRVGVMSVRELG